MGSYYSQENDMIAASALPSSEEIILKIKDEIKNNNNHGGGKIIMNLQYSSVNIGYPSHDKMRKKLDNIIVDYLNKNYICRHKFLSNDRYDRYLKIKNIACYCDICVNKYKENFLK